MPVRQILVSSLKRLLFTTRKESSHMPILGSIPKKDVIHEKQGIFSCANSGFIPKKDAIHE